MNLPKIFCPAPFFDHNRNVEQVNYIAVLCWVPENGLLDLFIQVLLAFSLQKGLKNHQTRIEWKSYKEYLTISLYTTLPYRH